MDAATILVVDDEQPIVDLVVGYLKAEGFQVVTARDGPGALRVAREVRPALVVLDVMLPGIDGLEVCRRLQAEFPVYVLMLTARAEEMDKVVGLSVGADDYLVKPFSPRELVARVRAILRRGRGAHQPAYTVLEFDGLTIDADRREVIRGDQQVELTPREFDLLFTMAQQPGRVFTREQLLEKVWGRDFSGIDRVVDVHIGLVRKKLDDDLVNPALIQTVRGVGYKFVGRKR